VGACNTNMGGAMSYEEIKKRAFFQWETLQKSSRPWIRIGTGTCGLAAGAGAVLEALNEELVKNAVKADIIQVGCIGLCYAEPLIEVVKPGHPGVFYNNVTPETVAEIIKDWLVGEKPRPDLALGSRGRGTLEGIPELFELPVLKPQVRIALRNCGNIDPSNIHHYIANGGYEGFLRALSMKPREVIDEVKKSGLRGRGGAGFPTGMKWQFCRDAPGAVKYIVCNADEGDPGAFMDRAVMEGDPHAVLEGMLIGAYAMGASAGYIYIRAEYPLAITRLKAAMKQMEECRLLCDNILNSGFSFHLKIKEGAGAFVCGEETALMASIEGNRGMPRSRPPFPAQSGLWGKPTNINNVETWANVSAILRKGSTWYAGFGTEKSRGTKTFSLVGKVVRTGLIEVPMGIKMGEIIYGIGGGILGGKKFKAVQTGGPSGGCLPAGFLDSPVDFESLAAAGSIVGSGGMVVMDESTCMVDVAKYFLNFTQTESCGKCVPCRWGTRQMLQILEDITSGRGKIEDIDLLLDLGEAIKAGSLCGLGQTAPNPVISTIRHFRDEYEEHIKRAHCPATVCKGLVKAPCSHACPAGVDVPHYIRLIAEKDYDGALAVILESIPFPSVCGYVCFHPCEAKCRRGQLDEPVAIRALKRFVADHGKKPVLRSEQIASPSGKRVAVVGSGPAGLSAAYYLAKLGGHAVTVFEALPRPGGMLRVGIPRYRLPEHILDSEIEAIKKVGVEIKTNVQVESIDSLREQGHDAIFLALGAHGGVKMRVEGEESQGVMDCVSLLRDVSLGRKCRVGQRVAIVGGGNAAIDASRTALRLGARDVTILYRRTRDEMPASEEEIEEALMEGVKIEYLVAPNRISRDNGKLTLRCMRMHLGGIDSGGRRRPEPTPGSEFVRECDTIIAAVGQTSTVSETMEGELKFKKGFLPVDPDTFATDMIGVFAAGDVVSGPASVIEAIGTAKRAAISIDQYLGGKGLAEEKRRPAPEDTDMAKTPEEGDEKHRPKMPMLSARKRLRGFRLVELGFSEAQAIEEAQRCLRCDLEQD
jgi:NADH-quinone oxidoreductase subunit F